MIPSQLNGKKIWLVGASEGIGKCLAERLAQEGAQIALSARQADKLNGVLERLEGSAHMVLPMDVQDAASVQAAYVAIKAKWGTPDMVIYNAGYYEPMRAQEFDLPRVEKMLDINLRGALRVLNHILPDFITANSGHIALVGSIAAYRGLPGAIGYGASKAALMHVAENLAVDLQCTNIKVQVISPGFVKTKLTAKNNFAMPQIMEPEEAAWHIMRGLKSDVFEVVFPWAFSTVLKIMSLLPAKLYFKLMREKSPSSQT